MTDYTLGESFDVKFTTRAFATGIPTTPAGSPAVSAYPDNSTTQLTAGITLSTAFDSVAGLNNVRVVATSGNGYASGSTYFLVLTAGTVDSVSVVGEVVGEFTLGRSAAAVDLANGTDGLGAIKTDTAAILVDTGTTLDGRIPAALVGGRIDASVGAMASGVLTATAIASGAITSAKFAANALDAVWSTATRLLTAGTNIVLAKGTGVTGFNDLSAAQVNAEADTALADYDAPTKAELDSAVATLATATNLAAVKTVADAVQVQTDKLTFTVANQIDANVQYVNDVQVNGTGALGDEWGP